MTIQKRKHIIKVREYFKSQGFTGSHLLTLVKDHFFIVSKNYERRCIELGKLPEMDGNYNYYNSIYSAL